MSAGFIYNNVNIYVQNHGSLNTNGKGSMLRGGAIARLLKGKVHLILPVTKDRLSSLLKTQNDINFGLAKTSVKP